MKGQEMLSERNVMAWSLYKDMALHVFCEDACDPPFGDDDPPNGEPQHTEGMRELALLAFDLTDVFMGAANEKDRPE
jgi:hypothetical protein